MRLTIVNELLRDDAGAGPVRLRRGGAGQLSEHGGAILLGIVLPCYGIPRRVHRGREGLFIPASYAIMPSLLSGDQLAAGNALSTAMVQAGSLLGPALGGALVATTHASTAAFAVDATSFGISALTLLLIPRGAAADAGEEVPAGGVLALLGRSRRLQVLLWW